MKIRIFIIHRVYQLSHLNLSVQLFLYLPGERLIWCLSILNFSAGEFPAIFIFTITVLVANILSPTLMTAATILIVFKLNASRNFQNNEPSLRLKFHALIGAFTPQSPEISVRFTGFTFHFFPKRVSIRNGILRSRMPSVLFSAWR